MNYIESFKWAYSGISYGHRSKKNPGYGILDHIFELDCPCAMVISVLLKTELSNLVLVWPRKDNTNLI